MNYRHAYHAGNFADVLKHAVLALVIGHLKGKPTAVPSGGRGCRAAPRGGVLVREHR